jgi:glycosyltransferase involved in cell wall biosynthesis
MYRTQHRKKRILLVPDFMQWILGTFARQINDCNKDKYDFFIFPATEMYKRPETFLELANNVDVLHCLNPWDFEKAKAICDGAGIRGLSYVYSIHHISEPEQVEACSAAHVVMTVSKLYQEYLKRAGVDSKKIEVINNGVDSDFFKPMDSRYAKKFFNIPYNAFTIGFAAKKSSDTHGRKGVDTFFDVINRLSKSTKEDIHVVITGPGWSEFLPDLKLDNVKLHYHEFLATSRMPTFYNSLDVYLICSRIEGGPVTLLEAMACGIPVVTTPVGHVTEIVKDRINGFVFEIDGVTEACEKILSIRNDRELKLRVSENARQTIVGNYRWQQTMLKAQNIYDRLDMRKIEDHDQERLAAISRRAVRRDNTIWKRNNKWYVKQLKALYRRFLTR